jgi:hypothetical protein
MSDNIDFKALWSQQTPTPPPVQALISLAQQFKKRKWYQLIGLNLLLVLTSFFIIGIWIYFQPQFISTKIGISLSILSMLLFVGFQNALLPLLKNENSNLDNQAYLNLLLDIKKRQVFLQTKVIKGYFLLLFLGISLYLFEYIYRMPFALGLLCYSSTFLWVAFNWFYLRPRVIKKQNLELNQLIEQFEQLNTQLIIE